MSLLRGAALALVLSLILAPRAEAQVYGSVALGAAAPVGDFGDLYDVGYTARGQVGLSLIFVDAHLQTGWSMFPAGGDSGVDDVNIYHAGAGARLGLGFLWVGANAAYFFGDGKDGIGFFPELGAKIWRVEGVLDFRVDGDEKWVAARVGLRF